MPDANALTYLNLQDAVLGRRFPASSQRTNAKRWLAAAYADVWTALLAEGRMWSFEYVFLSSLAISANDSTPTMPSDYADTIDLRDADGVALTRLSPRVFAEQFTVPSTSAPYAFTVVNRAIHLGPTPGSDATLTHTYRRRLAHVQSDGTTVVAGYMDEDGDYPLWAADHHGVLIPRATAIGLQEINDPTWQSPQEEYERQLARMRADLEHVEAQAQWPRADWYS